MSQKALDVARHIEVYMTQNPQMTIAELQGDTYLIFETPEDMVPLYAGIHYGANDSPVLDLADRWDSFKDQEGNTVDLAGKWMVNASDGTAGPIISNTANTVTAVPVTGEESFAWDAGDPYFWDISIEDVGESGSGYTMVENGATGIPIVSQIPQIIGLPVEIGRQLYPHIYEVMDQCILTGEMAKGTFEFVENEGETPKPEFSVFVPVKDPDGNYVQTVDGVTFMVSATEYLDVFNAPALEIEAKLQGNALEIEAGLTESATKIEADLQTNRDIVATEISDARESTQTMTWIVVVIMVMVVGLVSFVFGKSVTSPIKKLTGAADKVSKGDMSVAIDVKSKDEIGDLARSFGRMLASMKFMMEEEEESAGNEKMVGELEGELGSSPEEVKSGHD